MKLLALLITALLFSGCATDALYQVGKTVYIGGKKVVIHNWDELSPDVQAKLKAVDKYATKYNEGREIIKEELDASQVDGGSTAGGE